MASDLIEQIEPSKTIKNPETKYNVRGKIIEYSNFPETDKRKTDLINAYISSKTNATFKDNMLQGGSRHTRKNVKCAK